MIRAAGILFHAKNGTTLFLKRGPGGDHAGEWCFPGGKVEASDANAEATAVRETIEEIGALPPGKRTLLARSISNGIAEVAPSPTAVVEGAPGEVAALPQSGAPEAVDFTTFLQEVAEPFAVAQDDEHVGYAWTPCSSPPEPLHPGCRIALDRLNMDELGVARAMASGLLTSPQRYKNVTLWSMRITGTGVAVRRAVKDVKTGKVVRGEEFPWRDPANYLNDEFLARCNGLAVIWHHPKKSLLDSKEFEDRVVGSVFLPFIKGDEVWGVAKVYDDEANAALADGQEGEDGKRHSLSTSPAVVLSDPSSPSYKLVTEDGSVLLIEGKPSLLDHLAICERGVWDKDGDPAGIINHELQEEKELIMADDVKKADAEKKEDVKDDEKLDKLLSKMDECMSRMDSFEERFAKKDSDEKEEKKADGEKMSGDAEDVVADKKKADASDEKKDSEDEKNEKKSDGEDKKDVKDDAARADAAAARSETAELRKQLDALAKKIPTERTDADINVMTGIQARADAAFRAHGTTTGAPRFLHGEDALGYRRRLAREHQAHSASWKDVDLGVLNDSVMTLAENAIYTDSLAVAADPATHASGGLRMVRGETATGHKEIKFYGQPKDWLGRFGGAQRFVTKLNPAKQEIN